MKAERFIISFVAILLGLLVAGGGFYLYQMTRTVPDSKPPQLTIKTTPTPTPDNSDFLTVDSPKDESVFSSRTVSVTGKTVPNATIIISTDTTDQVVSPAANGNFTTTLPIDTGTSVMQVVAIAPSGQEKKIVRTVTYSNESF